MIRKTDLYTVDELLHLTLLRYALNNNNEEMFKKLHSPSYRVVKRERKNNKGKRRRQK